MTRPAARIRNAADGAILVEYPDATDSEANAAAVDLAKTLSDRGLPGLHDAIPGARTLFCSFEPRLLSHDVLAAELAAARPASASASEARPSREHRIRVAYGGEHGPDLPALAARAGIGEAELVRRHAAVPHRVAFLGFAPGFAYMTGLPPELEAPRRATPRTRVPAGSLAVAGPYTGIYPGSTPGGWNLIGLAAAVRLFDPGGRTPPAFLPGDSVRFEPSSPEALGEPAPAESAGAPRAAGAPVFRVSAPGFWSAAVGAPRYGRGAWGIPPSGAMDPEALALGNALTGNAPAAGGLEIALSGPELEALEGATVVLAGAPCEASVDGRPLARGEPHRLRAGARLRVGAIRPGVRAYLCVAGGLEESESAGAESPARLAAGMILRRGSERGSAGNAPALPPFEAEAEPVVRILLGPQDDRFTAEGVAALIGSTYRVSSASDRRGVRLEGPALPAAGGSDIPPEGTALGSIQVPADGQPIVLGPDRPVTGGYAKIATVVAADFHRIAQARPGTALRFRAVSLADALEARGRMTVP